MYSVKHLENTLTQTNMFGGYITYWKLVADLFRQLKTMKTPTPLGLGFYLSLAVKLPWWLFIKPLGWFFSTKIFYHVVAREYEDGRIVVEEEEKRGALYLFRILPIFPIFGRLNEKDLKAIFKEKAERVE